MPTLPSSIGSGACLSNSAVLYAWHTARVKKIEDVFAHELIVSTSGTASRLNWTVLNNVVGTKFKIITGYKGTTDGRLAMVRGEVDALSQPWSVLKSEGEQLLKNRQINLLLQSGIQKNSDLPHVPRMVDLAKTEAGPGIACAVRLAVDHRAFGGGAARRAERARCSVAASLHVRDQWALRCWMKSRS